MNTDNIKFQSYSWSYGTTSFRVSELKYKIERQLIRLKELWLEHPNSTWREIQNSYFDILVEEGLSQRSTKDKEKEAKEARQKTSSLKDLGFITENRKLTPVGEKLYKINKQKNIGINNIFGIRDDNFIYFKQLLKIEFSKYSNSRNYSDFKINPLLSIIYYIIQLDYVSKDEFTYLLPLVRDVKSLKSMVEELKQDRTKSIYSFIKQHIQEMQNYKDALEYFLTNEHNIETFEIITMDRKSKKSVQSYYKLYLELYKFFTYKDSYNEKEMKKRIEYILKSITSISTKNRTKYYKLLFNSSTKNIKDENITYFINHSLVSVEDEKSFFKEVFFLIHSIKWYTNLEEYYDLNKRYLLLSDIFVFEDEKIFLDDIVSLYMQDNIENFLDTTLSYSKEDYQTKLISDIELNYDEKELYKKIKSKFPQVEDEANLKQSILKIKEAKKIQRFKKLISKRFSDEDIIKLLTSITKRDDKFIKSYLPWECDIPTIFEYIIGICWYKISDFQGDLSSFLNMSLDASLLPVRFAGGGKADIVFKYDTHDLMIEVTLSKKENQRKMELEPVSRHLGRYMLQNKGNHYAIFVASHLDANVLVGLRSYSKLRYYNTSNTNEFVQNLQIIPLDISDIIQIIKSKMSYNTFYKIVNDVYKDKEEDGYLWYKNVLQKSLRG